MKILQLNLHGEYFDDILAEIKKDEYRAVKAHWARQLLNLPDNLRKKKNERDLNCLCAELVDKFDFCPEEVFEYYNVKGFKEFTHIMFSNGFAKDRRQMLVKFKGVDISKGKVEWGAVKDVFYFNIKLGEVIEKIRC